MAALIIINKIYKCALTLYINTHIIYAFRYTLPAVMTGSLCLTIDGLSRR